MSRKLQNRQSHARPRRENDSSQTLARGILIGPLAGAILGFLVILVISGKLPFAESSSMIGDMRNVVLVFYFYAVLIGAAVGLIAGLIVVGILALLNR